MAAPIYERVALIGMGLIGSSISHAARRAGVVGSISGSARTTATLETARRLGLVDVVCTSAADAAKDADLIVLCVPVGAVPIAREIAPVLKPGACVTDVGSVKGAVLRDVSPHLPEGVHFVPGHPIAGTEHSGPGTSGFAELFDNRWTILTPPPDADAAAVDRLKAFWGSSGVECRGDGCGASRHGAGHHQSRAAPDRL